MRSVLMILLFIVVVSGYESFFWPRIYPTSLYKTRETKSIPIQIYYDAVTHRRVIMYNDIYQYESMDGSFSLNCTTGEKTPISSWPMLEEAILDGTYWDHHEGERTPMLERMIHWAQTWIPIFRGN